MALSFSDGSTFEDLSKVFSWIASCVEITEFVARFLSLFYTVYSKRGLRNTSF